MNEVVKHLVHLLLVIVHVFLVYPYLNVVWNPNFQHLASLPPSFGYVTAIATGASMNLMEKETNTARMKYWSCWLLVWLMHYWKFSQILLTIYYLVRWFAMLCLDKMCDCMPKCWLWTLCGPLILHWLFVKCDVWWD